MEQNTTFSKHKVRELRNCRLSIKQKPFYGHNAYVTCEFQDIPWIWIFRDSMKHNFFFFLFLGVPLSPEEKDMHSLWVCLCCCERYMEGLKGIERNHRRTAALKNMQQQTLQGCKGFPLRPNHLVDPHVHHVRTGPNTGWVWKDLNLARW